MEVKKNIVIGLITLLITGGCNADTATSKIPEGDLTAGNASVKTVSSHAGCAASHEDAQNFPAEVLLGTEIEAATAFIPGDFSVGTYRSENGGAEIIVTLRELETGLVAERQYREPGMPPEVTSFTDLCRKDGQLWGKSLNGKFVKGGLLWLELQPEIEFISSDLWVHLSKEN